MRTALALLTAALTALVLAAATSAAEPSADVSVRIVAPDHARVGDAFIIKLVVRNHGPDAATGVELRDRIRTKARIKGVSLAGGHGGGNCHASNHHVRCDSMELPAGAVVRYFVRPVAEKAGSMIDRASITSEVRDPVPENNRAKKVVEIRP